MAFDYKKEYKEYYMPSNKPEIVSVPEMNYVAIRGQGNPNEEGGEYKNAVGILYSIAYTIKMSYMGNHQIEGYFKYVVPPLEGLWWQDGIAGFDYTKKDQFHWISMIRLPEFVTREVFDWALREAEYNKKLDCSKAEFMPLEEGVCVQMMHLGAFDNEPVSVNKMDLYIDEKGYSNDFTDNRRHHEIYLSDPRKTALEKCKTVIRHPIKQK